MGLEVKMTSETFPWEMEPAYQAQKYPGKGDL